MNASEVLLLAAQILALLLSARVVGKIAKLIGLPRVAGELAAGILLGPTLLGTLWPATTNFFSPANSPVTEARAELTHAALLFFLLGAGMELQLKHLKENARSVAFCAAAGIAIPFALGWLIVMTFPSLFSVAEGQEKFMAFFVGTALSISALPVIAKILIDLNLMQTRFGTMIMCAAAVDDLIGWIFFSFLLVSFQGGGSHGYQVFGAFILGVILSGTTRSWEKLHAKFLYCVTRFFAPLFFASIGLKINFVKHFDFPLFLGIFIVACAGKIAGVSLGARLSGLSGKESLAMGFAMNARGAMGMVLAAAALKYGMIQENLFTALVLMALGTSIMSGPALRVLLPKN